MFGRRVGPVFAVLACCPVIVAGVNAGVRTAAYHEDEWQTYRRTIAQVLKLAPDVTDGTVVVFVDAPFVEAFWCDMGMRLAYPGRDVAGVAFGQGVVGVPARATEGGIERLGGRENEWFLVEHADRARLLVFRADPSGALTLLEELPEGLWPLVPGYAPRARVSGKPASPRALRRFGD